MATPKQSKEYYIRQQQKRRKERYGVIPKPNSVLHGNDVVTHGGEAVTYGS